MADHGPLKRPRPDTGEEDRPDRGPLKIPKSEPGEEDIVLQVRKADVAPKLTCIGCNGFYRGPVRSCKKNHEICSSCLPDGKKQCPIMGCGEAAITISYALSGLVKDLGLPVSCKFSKKGCEKENADEEAIAEHETECGYRKLSCLLGFGCPDQLVKDLETHIFSAHVGFRICRDNPDKWLCDSLAAHKMWINSESGHRFWAILCHNDEKELWTCRTVVFGGKNVAKKYRVEMRLSSNDVNSSLIFNCDVRCLDDWKEWDDSKMFCISDNQFKLYNKGHIEIGDHNKDKNGELRLPVTIKVEKKKLG